MGRLANQKNFSKLISIFKYLCKRTKNYILLIIGDGPEEEKLKNKINLLGLKNKIILHGFEKTNPYRFLRSARVLITTTKYEGFGNIVVESLAVGTPVISTPYNFGIKEIIAVDKRLEQNKAIILLKNTSSYEEYYESIQYLVRKKRLRYNLNEFDLNKIGEKYFYLIKNCL